MVIAEVEAIWSAIDRDDDWAPLAAKIAAIRATGAFNRPRPPLRPERPPRAHPEAGRPGQ